MCMWVEMDVLWGNCSVLCRMYGRGKVVVREWLCQPGLSRAPRLGFQTPKFKRDIQHVMPSVNVITFSEREEESADFKNMDSPRSPPSLIDMHTCCLPLHPVSPERVWSFWPPPPRGTRAHACQSFTCLSSVRVPRHPSPPGLRLQLEVRANRC